MRFLHLLEDGTFTTIDPPGSIGTDDATKTSLLLGINGLVDVGYDKHFRVNHYNNEFSRGDGAHINGIESFWSFAKRRLNETN